MRLQKTSTEASRISLDKHFSLRITISRLWCFSKPGAWSTRWWEWRKHKPISIIRDIGTPRQAEPPSKIIVLLQFPGWCQNYIWPYSEPDSWWLRLSTRGATTKVISSQKLIDTFLSLSSKQVRLIFKRYQSVHCEEYKHQRETLLYLRGTNPSEFRDHNVTLRWFLSFPMLSRVDARRDKMSSW